MRLLFILLSQKWKDRYSSKDHKRAENELGELFDLRDFHDVVLRRGSIPLDLLESEVVSYIEETALRKTDRK